jgi:hypothetical protein
VKDWFNKNYIKLRNICKSISKENDVDELLHFCIDNLITNDKFNNIVDDNGKTYYFTRVVINNWKSKSSPYYTTYRKEIPRVIDYDIELADLQVEEEIDIDMEWVRTKLKHIMNEEWYYGRLFELYIEEGCNLTRLNKRTTIPLVSLSRDINKVREILKQKRKQDLYGL